MDIIKKTYDNIIQLAKENGLLAKWELDWDRPGCMEDYFDDYCDREIVDGFLSDAFCNDPSVKWKTKAKWEKGFVNWRKQKITII
jgi:hypothetical protein